MKAFFEALLDALSRGENAVLCSVLSASGSTPRGAGAKMAVFADGHVLGTVGGGAVERAAMEQAMRVHQGEAGDMRSFCFAPNQLADLGMICGGNVTVSFRLLSPGSEADRAALQAICGAIGRQENTWLVFRLQGGAVTDISVCRRHDAPLPQLLQSTPVCLPEEGWYAEPLVRAGTVYIVGGGHVGRALAGLLPDVGFRVAVYDEREKLAHPENYPKADRILYGPFAEFTKHVAVSADDFIVIMTPGHLADRAVLLQALATPACYIGCIGSRRKVEKTNEALREAGVSQAELARIHAPIGLEIFAETPAEIAVSIAAELIRERALRAGTRKASRAAAPENKQEREKDENEPKQC